MRTTAGTLAGVIAACSLVAGCGSSTGTAVDTASDTATTATIPPAASPRAWSANPPASFAFAIGDGMLDGGPMAVADRLGRYGFVVVDGQEVTPAQVAALHARGTRVLAYLSVGTIEKDRPWFASVKADRLELWQQWGEWYADTSAPQFRDVLLRKVAPAMLDKGVDGLFLDNTDMVSTHPAQRAGMITLIDGLAAEVHAEPGRALFAQNGDDVVGLWAKVLDGWNREDVSATYGNGAYVPVDAADSADAVATLKRLRALGLVVTTTDYVAAGDRSRTAAAVRTSCAAGALPWVADIELTRLPAQPLTCS